MLARYSPLEQGGARLSLEFDGEGKLTRWVSANEVLLPPALALASDLRKAERDALNRFFQRDGEPAELPVETLVARMAETQIYHARTRRLALDGAATDSVVLAIRDGRGDFLVAIYDPAKDEETIFDPPIPILSANLNPGHAWEATGQRGTDVDYRYSAKVLERAPFENEAGSFRDVLTVEARLSFSVGNETVFERRTLYHFAPELGVVESRTYDPAGKLESRTILASARDHSLRVPHFPTPAPVASPGVPSKGAVADWQLTRFASTRSATDNSESTIPPTYVPTDPPMMLAARYGSGLVAFNALEAGAPALWRFEPGGTIYGPPAYDPARGRIFFGAADKRLYALDTRGLFLWSFATGDNIVTRPIVVGDHVIFGSEDRHIYCLRSVDGTEVWRKPVGGPVVSSPVLVNGSVIFGSDDGSVYAFDPKTGERRWRFAADEPIEAPIVAAGEGRVLAGTHGGRLILIDAIRGTEIWSARAGGELRSAPVLVNDAVYLVSGSGRLSAYDFATGRRRWSSDEEDYVGPAVAHGDQLIVGTLDGDVHAIDSSGKRQQTWPAANASAPSDGPAGLQLGGSAGGGAIWFADRKSVLRRLGPPIAGAKPLRAAWLLPFSKEPFTQHFFTVSPVAYGERIVIVDDGRDIFLLEKNGKGERVGSFGESGAIAIEPTVAGDTLLTISGTTLYASSLPNGAARWKFDAKTGGVQPVRVAGNTVFWLTQDSSATGSGKLHAIDLASGGLRWEQTLTGFTGIGGALPHGDLVYTSAPLAAFSAATGEPRWVAKLEGGALGGGTLNETGEILYGGLIDEQTGTGSIVALRTADGSALWRAEIGASPLHMLERPWLSGDVLVVPLWSGEVIGLTAATGAERWRHKPPKPRHAITVAEGRVWFAQNNSRVVALDAADGRVAAQLSLDLEIGNIKMFAPRPLVLGERVIVPLGMALLGLEKPTTEAP